MKRYEKPIIDEEILELEDVIAASTVDSTENGVEVPFPFGTNS